MRERGADGRWKYHKEVGYREVTTLDESVFDINGSSAEPRTPEKNTFDPTRDLGFPGKREGSRKEVEG